VVDSRVQNQLVAGELLHEPMPAPVRMMPTRSSGCIFVVHVFLGDWRTRAMLSKGQAEIVHHQSDGAIDLFRPGGDGRGRRQALAPLTRQRLSPGRTRHAFLGN